ncbi:MAG: acetylornithine deacetylase [Acidobacteria bacterium]|nr:acetylornithine deacetylase [Acidobacteriota bacterium]
MNVEETLAKLVAINSVSSNSNVEIISFLAAHCERMGMCARLLPYRDERGVKKINLIAVAPRTTKDDELIELALVGHTDTVPYDPNWLEATELTARDGRLYGRGACDTKAFIAAALTAIESTDRSRFNRPVALVFTADEEVGCLGAKRLEQESGLRVRYSIVGEPTSLQPIRAGKGYCLAEVVVRGIEGHSAYPAVGASAIFRAARLVSHLERIAEEIKQERQDAFDPPYTTLNVGLINGGTAKNIIPGQCRLTLEWRPVPGQKAERVLDLLRAAVEDEKRHDAGFDCRITPVRLDGGMETPADSVLVRLLEEASGREAGTIAFGTEAPQMIGLGAQAVVFGPGDIRVAHRTGEFVPVEELHASVAILKRAIEHFCL